MTPKEAAEKELDDTIRRLGPAMDIVDSGDLIVAWALTGHAVKPEDVGSSSRYFHAYSGGTMPTHVAVGLHRLAQVTLENGDDEVDE